MSKNVVTINNTKETEFNFDINIKGISPEDLRGLSKVRFVIEDVNDYNLTFKCERRELEQETTSWYVKIPALTQLKRTSYTFHIEVIVDGFYFEPASGPLYIVSTPNIEMAKEKESTSPTSNTDTIPEQHGGQVDMTDTLTPSNSLLTTEFPPEDDNKESDPEKIAQKIVQETLGKNVKPSNPGFLFERTRSGKVLVEGIDNPELLRQKLETSERVKKILFG